MHQTRRCSTVSKRATQSMSGMTSRNITGALVRHITHSPIFKPIFCDLTGFTGESGDNSTGPMVARVQVKVSGVIPFARGPGDGKM